MTASGRPRKRSADEARLIQRFVRLAPQRDALVLALGQFSDDQGRFDQARWECAFGSDDPGLIVAVKAVTGIYEGLVNHLVEMLHMAARLRGLEVAARTERPSGPELFAAVAADGGLTRNQVDVLRRLYGVRNELQHASPGVDAAEVHDAVVLLRKTLGRFATSYVEWLERHGVSVL